MINETIVVFRPSSLDYAIHSSSFVPNRMVERIAQQHPHILCGQLRLYSYVMGGKIFDLEARSTGLVYTRGEEDNPLSRFEPFSFVEGMDNLALALGANVSANEINGRLEIENPKQQDYIRVLEAILLSQFEHVGMGRPEEVRRFVLDLDSEIFARVIRPYLAQKGYTQIQRVTIR